MTSNELVLHRAVDNFGQYIFYEWYNRETAWGIDFIANSEFIINFINLIINFNQ
jgi:hypothetical protein